MNKHTPLWRRCWKLKWLPLLNNKSSCRFMFTTFGSDLSCSCALINVQTHVRSELIHRSRLKHRPKIPINYNSGVNLFDYFHCFVHIWLAVWIRCWFASIFVSICASQDALKPTEMLIYYSFLENYSHSHVECWALFDGLLYAFCVRLK